LAWIKTITLEEADERLLKALGDQHSLYPKEYAEPVQELDQGLPGIVAAHTLIPEALYHAFATFGALMSPELPLERRQHEMIATMVSLTNKCHY
jgi:alkylhydroperoxidase family enzyme